MIEARLITEADAARYISMSRSYLANARSTGDLPSRTPAPPFIKLGKAIRYDLADLNKWIDQHRRKNGRSA